MEKLTGEKIIEILSKAIEEEKIELSDFAYLDSNELGLGKIETVQDERDPRDPDNYLVVIHFKDHGVHVMTNGYYSSQFGTEFDGELYLVEPKEVMYTEYHVIKK